nr:integrase, catalytic region, zinc finger, CCHC-type, peptidase aspartic, catalytic [Tanacetum cinerariifolium]
YKDYSSIRDWKLKKKVKKLEKKASKRTHKLKRLYKIGSSRGMESSDETSLGDQEDASKQRRIIDNLNANEGVTLVDETQERNDQDIIVATAPTISMDHITLVKELAALKSAKPMVKEPSVPKTKGIVMKEPKETTIRTTTVPSQSSNDKGKAKVIEPEKPLQTKDQIMINEEENCLVPQRQKASDYNNSDPIPQIQNILPSADTIVSSQRELDLLFGPLYDEFFNAGTSSVNKTSSLIDNSKQRDTPPTTNIQSIMNIKSSMEPTNPTNANAEENNDNQAKDEFTNSFRTPVGEIAESSSCNIEQVRRNPSKPVQTRRQLVTDPEMCMFALTVSTAEPKNIMEAMFNTLKLIRSETNYLGVKS